MPKKPDLTLFLDILLTLERLDISYAIIGGYAATIYGNTRATFDIDIIVSLKENDIQKIAEAYPPPRYYADAQQMERAVAVGTSFNIIDSERGEKADLFPLSADPRYTVAFENRLRQTAVVTNMKPFAVWVVRPEDVILGKLMAWQEGQSSRHPADIFEIMLFYYLGGHPEDYEFDEAYVDARSQAMGETVSSLWQLIKKAAREEAERHR